MSLKQLRVWSECAELHHMAFSRLFVGTKLCSAVSFFLKSARKQPDQNLCWSNNILPGLLFVVQIMIIMVS